jgi:photosystem II stability/assembly factor-like uncharacterized protein
VPQTATAENLRGVHWPAAGAGGSFVAVGWSGTTIRRDASGSWELRGSAPLLYHVAEGPGGEPLAVGGAGALLRGTAGGQWSQLAVVRDASLYGAASEAGSLLAVGDAGLILRYDGTHWLDESVRPHRLLRSIWIDPGSGNGFVVGERGIVLHRRGRAGRWAEQPPLTTQFLRHVFGLSDREVFAVGDRGTVLRWNGLGWRAMVTPSDTILRGVWASGPDDVFAVGGAGTILRYDGVRWYPMPSPTSRELRAVWGTGPTDVYAAGEQGTLLRFDGARWTRMTSPTRQFLLGFQPTGSGLPRVVGSRGIVLVGER